MFYTQTAAAVRLDPTRPLSVDTMRKLHDAVDGPRDSAGRRIYTDEVIARMRSVRVEGAKGKDMA